MTYITQHFLDEDINLEVVADACHCSARQLYRAFEGRSATLNTAIRTLRLYKARELLQKRPELSVEKIAISLHFTDAKHLANQYRKLFHRSPREDRKTILPPKQFRSEERREGKEV